ncbi:MAG TPA: glycosyltransferase [Gemmatimonadota bacterium]|nr:glycosyltransferase [Gemmatimonadota bacterium]
MITGSGASMSVVIVTHDDFHSIARPVRHLQEQTVRDRIELVIVASSRERLGPALEPVIDAGFHAVRVVEHGAVGSRGSAAASGVRAARAPIVGFVENHSYPASRWAESLLRAHEEPWAVVGPGVENANPDTRTSRVNFLLTYGRWAGPLEAGEVDLLPFHNSAYKRDWLDGYGVRLGAMLDAEYWLQADIRSRGGRLYLEPAARTAHTNEPRFGASLRLFFGQGRAFGSRRSEAWSGPRRAGYVLGAPAIPLMNLPRALRETGRSLPGAQLAASVPSILLHLAAHGAGEAAAYLTGSDGDREFLVTHEFSHRPETGARS